MDDNAGAKSSIFSVAALKDGLSDKAPCLLASVRNAREAAICIEAGVDIIDAKEPNRGALGAVDACELRKIRDVVFDDIPVSATLGDDARGRDVLRERILQTAYAGGDILKIGVYPDVDVGELCALVQSLRQDDARVREKSFVAVLLADLELDLSVLHALADAGFLGAMMDTQNKSAGTLLDIQSADELSEFTRACRRVGLLCGLAGGLRKQDIPAVLAKKPDILGFRGALSEVNKRTRAICPKAVKDIRSAVPNVGSKYDLTSAMS